MTQEQGINEPFNRKILCINVNPEGHINFDFKDSKLKPKIIESIEKLNTRINVTESLIREYGNEIDEPEIGELEIDEHLDDNIPTNNQTQTKAAEPKTTKAAEPKTTKGGNPKKSQKRMKKHKQITRKRKPKRKSRKHHK
jgi:hypothetical protein